MYFLLYFTLKIKLCDYACLYTLQRQQFDQNTSYQICFIVDTKIGDITCPIIMNGLHARCQRPEESSLNDNDANRHEFRTCQARRGKYDGKSKRVWMHGLAAYRRFTNFPIGFVCTTFLNILSLSPSLSSSGSFLHNIHGFCF